MSRAVHPADRATPAAIRKRRKQVRQYRAAYHAKRAEWLAFVRACDRASTRDALKREDLAWAAIEARDWYRDSLAGLALSERIAREMADGTRDTLGRELTKDGAS